MEFKKFLEVKRSAQAQLAFEIYDDFKEYEGGPRPYSEKVYNPESSVKLFRSVPKKIDPEGDAYMAECAKLEQKILGHDIVFQ